MKSLFRLAAVALLLLGTSGIAQAQTAQQAVTLVVSSINVLSVSSGTISMDINTAVAGSDPTAATNTATTYSVTTNGSSMKITAALGVAYASGLALALNLTAPSGGTSAGSLALTTTAQDMVTGISTLKEAAVGISYSATATAAVAPNGAGEAQTVTLTITS